MYPSFDKKMKNLRILLITLALILTSCESSKSILASKKESQNLNLEKIRNKFRTMYSTDQKSNELCDLYILDGIPFQSKEVDSVLKPISIDKIEFVSFVKNTFSHKNCGNITIISSTPQKKSKKKANLETIKKIYKEELPKIDVIIRDKEFKNCPILIIDNLPIQDVYKSKRILDTLKSNNLSSVYYFPRKLKPEFWGSRYESGLVIIKTKM